MGKPSGVDIAHIVMRSLADDAGMPRSWEARAILWELARHALVQIAEYELRREKFEAELMVDGQRVKATVAARYGIRGRDENGARDRVVQYPLWVDEPWEALEQLREAAIRQAAEMMQRIQVFDAVLGLRERCPEARTPRAAFEAAGIEMHPFRPGLASGE